MATGKLPFSLRVNLDDASCLLSLPESPGWYSNRVRISSERFSVTAPRVPISALLLLDKIADASFRRQRLRA